MSEPTWECCCNPYCGCACHETLREAEKERDALRARLKEMRKALQLAAIEVQSEHGELMNPVCKCSFCRMLQGVIEGSALAANGREQGK